MATLTAVQMQEGDPTGQNAAAFDVGGLKVQAVTVVDPDTGEALLPRPPVYSSVTIMSATTDAAGTGWVDFSAQDCTALDIVNASNTTIEYRRNGAGVGMPIPARSSREAVGITNADQISVRRVDQLTDQVTVYAEAMQ